MQSDRPFFERSPAFGGGRSFSLAGTIVARYPHSGRCPQRPNVPAATCPNTDAFGSLGLATAPARFSNRIRGRGVKQSTRAPFSRSRGKPSLPLRAYRRIPSYQRRPPEPAEHHGHSHRLRLAIRFGLRSGRQSDQPTEKQKNDRHASYASVARSPCLAKRTTRPLIHGTG